MLQKNFKEHRLAKHLSQKELADRSGISLRTVQRVEKNESSGSPYVIRTLCETLGIETNSLSQSSDHEGAKAFQEVIGSVPPDRYLKYINVSSLSVLLFPFLNVVVVTGTYLIFRKKFVFPNDRATAQKMLSLQIIWSVATLFILIFTPLIDYCFLHVGEVLEIPLFIWIYLVLLFSHLLITMLAAARLNMGKDPIPYIPNII
ncbi:helix-turn-helix domain-containing protein [Pedobacter sp. KBS0701]|uniref:helix-turn-helix domain-containing protein n=1 Tax=Pedobacter sp. KBS0701 TaxID=2578106 RepID=UPI00110F4620|nr:helix-turn-helix domain-containing protein [Pedobacter sp. KBS0701]QDW24117.1 helix-turn-helix domain-containing protein [Pedobacter sp. KBS0701]